MFLGMQLAGSWCEVATLATVAIGGVWALLQWLSAIRAQRAETMVRLFELCEKKDVYLTFNFYVLGEKKLPRQFYIGNLEFADPEGKDHKPANVKTRIDTMLTFFNQVCYMKRFKFIKKAEVVIFENQIRRLFDSRQITAYLSDLQKESGSAFPYALLVHYDESNGCCPCKC